MKDLQENILLKDFTTFKIGGPARYFFEAKSKKDITEAIIWARDRELPYFVLGGGSNVLISDNGFSGLVVKCTLDNFKVSGSIVDAEAGIKLADLLKVAQKQELSGLEWSSGIPSITLGGALFNNAGAFGQKIADIVEQVEVLDAKSLEIKTLQFQQCQFDYKQSIFKSNKNLIILSAKLALEQKDSMDIKKEIKRILDYRKGNHPIALPSAGCIFKNPRNQIASKLIEDAGVKGERVGDAQVSEQHCNFIVNLGKATASDVIKLIKLIKAQVAEKFNIKLEEEIQILGNI